MRNEETVNKRNLSLRKYQAPVVEGIHETKKPITVLAAAPNAGKTEIAIATSQLYLSVDPDARILILTHGTVILLENFKSRLKGLVVDFTFSDNLSDNSQVHLCIPQNMHKIKGTYDYLIVDEAHEHYLASDGRVGDIIKAIKPKKQLLLTATPSKFIGNKKYNIIAIAANELPLKYMAKVALELVESGYDWMGNYNRDNDVKAEFVTTIDDTKKSFENVMLKLMSRLNYKYDAEQFNNPGILTKAKTFFNKKVLNWNKKSWGEIFTEVGKTMIVAKTIDQAGMIKDVLDENGIHCTMSHHKNDSDSEELFKFQNNEVDIVVVVRRGILGYSDEKLMNIIDMSGTHNPDMIYQLFGRLLRGGEHLQKYYIKLTPKHELDKGITEMATSAALMLTDRRFLLQYNGRNLKDIKIPVKRDVLNERNKRGDNKNSSASSYLPHLVSMDIIRFFKDVIHDSNEDASIYKLVTYREVSNAFGYTKSSIPLTKAEVFASAGIILED